MEVPVRRIGEEKKKLNQNRKGENTSEESLPKKGERGHWPDTPVRGKFTMNHFKMQAGSGRASVIFR